MTIPESVTTIGESAFAYCSGLTSVTIPDNVLSVGSFAFANSGVKELTIENGEETISIGEDAFDSSPIATMHLGRNLPSFAFTRNMQDLKNLTISDNVTSLGSYAFYGCDNLETVTIPNSVTTIGESAFAYCSGLTSVTIPDNVLSVGSFAFANSGVKELTIENGEETISIGEDAFDSSPIATMHLGRNLPSFAFTRNMQDLKNLTISDNVTSLGNYAFSGCKSLETVTIPNSVTTIGDYIFSGCSGLTSVTIPNSVTTIGNSAFSGCSGLTSVTIPESVTTIGDYAFRGCSGLTSLTIPNNVLSVGSSAFANSGIKELTIEDGEETMSIGEDAFDSCPIATLHLDRNLSSFAFTEDMQYLRNLTISDNVTSLGNYAFSGCKSLETVTIPNSVTTIGDYIFSGCSGLTSVTIPNSVTSLGNSAFKNCSGLTSLTIPESVTTIGESAFENCSGLTSVTIPDNVLSVGSSAFASSGVKELTIEVGEETISIGEDAFDSSPIATLNLGRNLSSFAFTRNMQDLKNLTISDNVTSLGSYAFYNCNSLETVTIPNSITSIDRYVFNSCDNLKSVTMGAGVLSIGESAFDYTDLIKTIWLPNTPPDGYADVKSKCNYVANESYTELSNKTVYPYLSSMFETGGLKYVPVSPSERTCDAIDCSYDKTTDIIIGKTVNYKGIEMTLLDVKDYLCYNNDSIKTLSINEYGGRIGRRGFQDCTSLESIEIHNMADSIGDAAFYNCINLKTVDISGVGGNIGEGAFSDCTSLETVSLSDIMGGIGSKSFYNCENLGGIEIPNTVTGIGSGCFQNCSSLAYAIIGSGVSELPEDCFYGCSSLPEIAIPATVESVGNSVFYGCTTLARVDIEDRQSELSLGCNSVYSSSDQRPLFSDCPLDSVYIGGNISYATGSDSGYSPFYRNTSLRAVKITDQETEISENEFYGCTGLTTVELGDGIETIGNYAFSGCSALDSFSFGHSVTAIGEEAFSDCTAMTRLQSRAEMPPLCGNQALDDINKWTCELFVPAKSLDAYKAAEQWKEFFFITGEDYDKPGSVDAVSENGGVSVATYRDSIEIIGADNAVITVYNTNGQIVYSGTETTVGGLAQGIYIVQVGGQTFKVAL